LILVDASGLFEFVNEQDPQAPIRRALDDDPGPFVLSPFVLAEVDYLLGGRGVDQEIEVLREVAAGAYVIAPFDAGDVEAATDVVERYRDLGIGLADASIVVLAGRHGTNRVLTLDERHFRALRTPAGKPFTILPADG
jgi:uncharacterized protein